MNAILKGELPESRCNMGFASDSQFLYILGGQDLNKGIYNDLWRLNLQAVRDNIRNAQWEQIFARGDPPK